MNNIVLKRILSTKAKALDQTLPSGLRLEQLFRQICCLENLFPKHDFICKLNETTTFDSESKDGLKISDDQHLEEIISKLMIKNSTSGPIVPLFKPVVNFKRVDPKSVVTHSLSSNEKKKKGFFPSIKKAAGNIFNKIKSATKKSKNKILDLAIFIIDVYMFYIEFYYLFI